MEDNPHISELAIKQLNRTHSLVCCIIILILGESCPIYIYIRPIQKKKPLAFFFKPIAWNCILNNVYLEFSGEIRQNLASQL